MRKTGDKLGDATQPEWATHVLAIKEAPIPRYSAIMTRLIIESKEKETTNQRENRGRVSNRDRSTRKWQIQRMADEGLMYLPRLIHIFEHEILSLILVGLTNERIQEILYPVHSGRHSSR